jgi:Cof subfamily protein (haloacid dehalogenase superfamily)
MPYRMLVTDLDFTCLNEEHEIPDGNLRAARRAIEEGLIFTVATGRGRAAADRLIGQLRPNAPVILQNGMSIYDFEKDILIREHLVDTDVSIRAVRWGNERGVLTVISIGERHYVSSRRGERVEALERLEGVPTVETGDIELFLMKERENVKVANVLYVCEPDEREAIQAEAALAFPEVNVIASGPPFVEFLSKDASKGHALSELCGLLKVDLQDVVVVGDAPNDVEMLMLAGMSYAVANAEDDIKKIAKKVTRRSNNDAVLPEVLLDAFGIEV